ncbi:MAG TPA: ABC transporter permease, partial [Kiloniellales bacterium]|nr:ABC transporter permease [Kiloniellales bacterium]
MFGYIIRRILAIIPVLLIVAIIVFLMLRLSPGDPAAILAGDAATPAQIERIRTELGLNDPLHIQFITWMGQILQGDLGTSLISRTDVWTMIERRLDPTINIAILTIIISVILAVPMGVVAAWKHRTWVDYLVMSFSVLGFSI